MVAGAGGGSSGGGGHGGGGGGGGSDGGGGEGPMLPLNFHGVTIALLEAKTSWDKNDKDRSGKLSLNEAIALLQRCGLTATYTLSKIPPDLHMASAPLS